MNTDEHGSGFEPSGLPPKATAPYSRGPYAVVKSD
jgi:hypothetical protein